MTATATRLRHLPFLAELAARPDSDPRAAAVRAGLVVLRLVDTWMEDRSLATVDSRVVRSAQRAIDLIPDGDGNQSVLREVVDAMLASPIGEVGAVAQCLSAYGRTLDLDAQWSLAIDVYDTIVEYLHPDEDCATVVNALLQRATCLRELGGWTEAAICCDTAITHAQHYGDVRGELRAQIGQAIDASARGNLPRADAVLAETVRLAGVHGLPDIRARANHQRAEVAFSRGDYEMALRYAYAALRECDIDPQRDRLLNDIAGAFYLLGIHSAVRDVYLILAGTAREQSVRWGCTINLMQIAAEAESREHFELYLKQLAGAALPPRLLAEFQLHVGRGYNLLGEGMLASEWFDRALATASAHSLNRLVFKVDDEIAKGLRSSWKRASPPTAVVSDETEEIAAQMRQLRELSLSSSE